jgi:CRISPR/Cas system-associated endonuclease Cas3-HD
MFANAAARVQLSNLLTQADRLSLYWTSRYVKQFYRGWESLGLAEYKQVVPAQLVHSIGIGYTVSGNNARISTNVELTNLTDEPTYDFFGVQRPRRALYAKTTLEL